MSQFKNAIVIDGNGLRGVVSRDVPPHEEGATAQVQVRLEDNRSVLVPARALIERDDGTFFLAQSLEEFRAGNGTVVVPAIEEELDVRKRKVGTGGVRVTKKVYEREELVDQPLLAQEVDVERVPINRLVESSVPIRYEGDTMIVPVLEEVLVVEKRLMLKEELRITKRQSETHQPQRVILRREEAIVEHLGGREETPQEGGARTARETVPRSSIGAKDVNKVRASQSGASVQQRNRKTGK